MIKHDYYNDDKEYSLYSLMAGILISNVHPYVALEQLCPPGENWRELFRADHYFIITVDIIDADYSIAIKSKPVNNSEEITFKQVSRYISEALSDYYLTIPFTANNNTYMLGMVHMDNPKIQNDIHKDQKEAEKFLKNTLQDIHDKIFREKGIYLQMLIGDLVYDIENLYSEFCRIESSDPNEFEPVVTYPQVKYIREKDRVFISPDDARMKEMPKLELALCKAAAAHDFPKIADLFLKIMNLEFSIFPAKKNTVNKTISRLSMIYSLSGTPPYVPDNPDIYFYNWMKDLRSSITITDIQDIVLTTLSAIQDFHLHQSGNEADNFSLILSFIDENYTDPSFCCSVICEKFDINISTFSRQFKERTGMKFVDYLHLHRIILAKKKLADDINLRMEDIAEIAGYTNTLTFFRAFKRIEGKTPGAYRLEIIHNSIDH